MAGSVTENVTKLSFASERMQAAERAHNFVVDFKRLQLSSRCRDVDVDHRFDLRRQTHAPDVDTDEMSNSRRSPSLIPDSVGIDHPCCRKPHGSLRSFSLTGTIC